MFSRNSKAVEEFVRSLDSDEVLDGLGLMRKSDESSSVWPLVGGVCLGLLCGVAIGFSFAPKKGTEWRGEVADKFKNRDFRGLAESARSGFASGESTGASGGSAMPGRSSTVI